MIFDKISEWKINLKKKKIRLAFESSKMGEMLGPKEWEQQIIALSQGQKNIKWMRYNFIVGDYNQDAYNKLNQIRYCIAEVSSDIIALIPSARWLFDNFQMMYREIKKAKTTGSSYEKLPVLCSGEYRNFPRIFILARKMVDLTGGYVNEDNITLMVNIYQREVPLTDKELWALPEMLGLCLLERIIEVSEEILHIIRIKAKANKFVKEGLVIKQGYMDIHALLHKVPGDCHENASFHCHVIYLLKNLSCEEELIQRYITFHCTSHNRPMNSSEVFLEEGKLESRLESNIRILIVSLREVNQIDEMSLFEELSVLEKILSKDPDGIYPLMDAESRGEYRRVVEKLSYRHKIAEEKIGNMCVELAMEGNDKLNCPNHVGTYLVGKGYPFLIAEIFNKPYFAKIKKIKNIKGACYFVLTFSILLILNALLLDFMVTSQGKANLIEYFVLLLIAMPILIGIALEITNDIITRVVPVKKIPSMDYIKEIPDSARTFVVMPVIVARKEQGIEYFNRLQKYYLANRQSNLYFALLLDYADAKDQCMPGDEEIKNATITRMEELNEQYPAEHQRFSLFIRCRNWNESEDCFMGWERKRGKLEEFNALLSGIKEEYTSFEVLLCDRELLGTYRYVITLDADSNLIRDNAAKLIGLIDHPLNRAVMDPVNRNLKEGYAIIQPSVKNHIVDRSGGVFSKLYVGQSGISNYSTVVSDVYQDVFKEGTYIGKGIYNISAFHQILHKTIPENSILSHDLLESCYVKTAFVSTANIMDNFPSSVLAFSDREHRWIRGDWQLLPWLYKKNLSGISRWKILDNMRRSLLPLSKTFIIISNLLLLPHMYFLSILLISFSDLLNLIILIGSIIIHKIRRPKLAIILKKLMKEIIAIFERAFIEIVLIPYKTQTSFDAIIRTLYRLMISKKNLLKWKTSENIEKSIENTKKSYFLHMWKSLIPAAIIIILVFLRDLSITGITVYLVLALLWVLSPLIAYRISLPNHKSKVERCEDEEVILREAAIRMWQFFKDFSTKENNWLCPDNYQMANQVKITSKTSPTNIGLQLLSVLSARDFGFETLGTTLDYIENILYTVAVLPKWKGHLFNWYNIKSLDVLNPAYISTVDSGNFFGDLIALKSGMIEQKHSPDITEEMKIQIDGLCESIDNMLAEVDFSALYNEKHMLFHIGYHTTSQVLDAGCYDLMASEALLTSFIAVARGEVPLKHWYKLGRPLTMIKGIPAFVSWSGSMFEYLMPNLLMREYEDSVFAQTSKAAVLQHIKYAKHTEYSDNLSIPWGISESQYYRFDLDSNYQYRAFGVPKLRLQPSVTHSMVVAPYATMLALDYAGKDAILNLKRMTELGAFGKYGFYESIDFNAPDPVNMQKYCIVKSFMAHHQGMSLVAINNYLHDSIMRKRFHQDPIIKATEILLEEKRQTYFISISKKGYTVNLTKLDLQEEDLYNTRKVKVVSPSMPVVDYLSNNNYSLMITSDGDGFSSYKDIMLYRWRADVYANTGNYIYIKDINERKYWSMAYHPSMVEPNEYQATFLPYQAEFKRKDGDIITNTIVSLAPNHNVEIRKMEFTNNGKEDKQLEITSYMEVVADKYMAELSHPAFNKLFIESEFIADKSILLSRRRSSVEDNPYLIHMVKSESRSLNNVEYENDRLKFIGRNNTLENPEAVVDSIPLSNSVGFSNDPIMSLRIRIILKPNEKTSVTFITGVCSTKEEANEISDVFSVAGRIDGIRDNFKRQSEMELKYLNISQQQFNAFQEIISPIYYPSVNYRGAKENIIRNWKNQSFLWRFGVSGDCPIMLLRVGSIEEAGIIRDVLKAYEYFRINRIKIDLIILSEAKHGYMQELTDMLNDMISSLKIYDENKERPSLFILHSSQMVPAEIDLLFTVARVVFSEKTGIYFRNNQEVKRETILE